jgi:hypothetical protein
MVKRRESHANPYIETVAGFPHRYSGIFLKIFGYLISDSDEVLSLG